MPSDALLTHDEIQAALLSLRVALVAVVGSLPIAVVIAWVLARRSFAGKILVEAVVMLPLVLPPVVTGYALLVLFSRNGFLGRMLASAGIDVVFNWKGAAVASAVMAFPLMVRPIRQAFESVDPRLSAAARTLGASPWRAFRTITMPLSFHGLISGVALGLARSMGEFGATIMIAGSIPGQTRTLPLFIYSSLDSPDTSGRVPRLVVFAGIISLAAVILSELLARRASRRASAGRGNRA